MSHIISPPPIGTLEGFNSLKTSIDAVVRKLPRASRDKITRFKAAFRKDAALRMAHADQCQEMRREVSELATRVGVFRNDIKSNNLGGDAALKQLANSEAELAERKAELELLQQEQIGGAIDPEPLLARLLKLGTKFKAFTVEAPLRKGQTAEQALSETRAEIKDTRAEMKAARLAPIPTEEAITAAIADLKRRAAKGAPRFTHHRVSLGPALEGRYFTGMLHMPRTHVVGGQEVFDAENFTIWANLDRLIDEAKSSLSAHDGSNALSIPARKKRVAELDALILSLERKEEAYIEKVERDGVSVTRRPDANPLAVLGLAIDDRALTATAPEPEPEETTEQMKRDIRRARLREMQNAAPTSSSPAPRMSDKAESEFG